MTWAKRVFCGAVTRAARRSRGSRGDWRSASSDGPSSGAGDGGERPLGSDGLAGLERDLDQRLAVFLFEKRGGHGAAFRDGDGFAFEEGGEGVEVFLFRAVIGRVVAAGALQLDAEKRGGDDVALGGEGRVVVGGEAEAGAAALALAAAEENQLGDETVEGFAVAEGLVEEKAEGAGVVEAGLQHAGIFREHVLPVAHPVIGVARIGEEAFGEAGAFVGGGVGEKGAGLGFGGRDADRIKIQATQKRGVADDGRLRDGRGGDVRRGPLRAGGDPLFERGDLCGLQTIAGGRHPLVVIGAANAREEFAGGGFAGDNGGRAGFAAFERGGEGVEFETAFFFFAVAAETLVFQEGQNGGVKLVGFGDGRLRGGGDGELDFLREKRVDGVGGLHGGSMQGRGGRRRRGRGVSLSPRAGVLVAGFPKRVLGRGGGAAGVVVEGGERLLDGGEGGGDGGVGERDGFGFRSSGLEKGEGAAVARLDGDGELAGIGAIGAAAEEAFDDDAVFRAGGDGDFAVDFLEAEGHGTEAGMRGRGDGRHRLVAAGDAAVGFGGRDERAVEPEAREAAGAEDHAVFAGRERDIGGETGEHGRFPTGADAPLFVAERQARQEKIGGGPARGLAREFLAFVEPAVVRGHGLVKRHLHAAGGQRAEVGHDGGRGFADHGTAFAAEAGFEFGVGDNFPVDRDGIHAAAEARAGGALHRRADPHGIIVDDGRGGGGATHIPLAGQGLAVDPTADGGRVSKTIGDGDVVPAGIGREAALGGPAVPVGIALRGCGGGGVRSGGFRRGEKEAEAMLAGDGAEAQGPVLVVGSEAVGAGAAFADDIDVFAGLGGVEFHPRFEGDRVAVGEIDGACGAGIGEGVVRARAVEAGGGVARFEIGKLGRTRAGNLALDGADGDDTGDVFLAEVPAGDGGGARGGHARAEADGKKERTETEGCFHRGRWECGPLARMFMKAGGPPALPGL
jgi:hypothetical protein